MCIPSCFPSRLKKLAWQSKLIVVVFCYSFISENPLVAKLQYGLKITFIFILILFIDSVNRVYRVQVELSSVTEGGNNAYVQPDPPSGSL